MAWSNAIAEALKLISMVGFNKRSTTETIKKVVGIYDSMKNVTRTTHAQRFLILKAENGGGNIRPGGQLYASVIYEDFRTPCVSVKEKYQRILIDQEYVRMLLNLYEHKIVKYVVGDMPDGILKGFYQSEHLAYSELHYIGQDKKAFYYCSLATQKLDSTLSTAEEKATILLAVNNIRNLMK